MLLDDAIPAAIEALDDSMAALASTVRRCWRIACKRSAFVALLLLGLAGAALAQEPEISDEQREILQSLPPEQQEAAIAEALRSRQRDDGSASAMNEPGGDVRRLSSRAPHAEPGGLGAGDSIIIELRPRTRGEQDPSRPPAARSRVSELQDRILQRNPYRLDRFGRLQLPGFEPLQLRGLSEELAAKRLATDRDLGDFVIKVTLLPLEPLGEDALVSFGYDLFTDAPSTFAPVTDIPVPLDYVVGPGDELRVQLFGNTNRSLALTVDRDGQVSFPQLGPIRVGGKHFSAVKRDVEGRVSQQMTGVRANVEIGETRSIRIFLLGEVLRPGSYTVSGLSTLTNALFAGGGISPVGSLRNVQLKRSGETLKTLDLYDLLLNGDTSNDARLMSGDVVFIPPVGAVVGIQGEILRPARYEIRPGATLAELIALSGDLTPRADPREGRLERINERGERVVMNLDLTSPEGRATPLRAGDLMHVLAVRETLEGAVLVDGHVLRPGLHEYRAGLRVTDVLSFADLKAKADTHYVMIRRELPPDRHLEVLSADLAAALAARGSDEDLLLAPRDRISVFDLQSGRDRAVSALIRELRSQATLAVPLQIATIGGRVRAPGQYPLEPGMRVSDLIRAGGSLEDAAYGGQAELARHQIVAGEHRQTDLIDIDLAALLAGDASADIELQPYDTLTIKELPVAIF